MWLQGAGPVLWSVSMSLAPSRAFAGHPPSRQETSVVRRAAVLRAPASATGTQQTLFSVLAEARCPWVSSAVSCGCPGGGSRVSLFSGPYLTPGSSCEVQQSLFSSLGTLGAGAPPGQGWCGGVSRTLPCRLSLVSLFVSGWTQGARVMCFA